MKMETLNKANEIQRKIEQVNKDIETLQEIRNAQTGEMINLSAMYCDEFLDIAFTAEELELMIFHKQEMVKNLEAEIEKL